jgi:hypothetical protein
VRRVFEGYGEKCIYRFLDLSIFCTTEHINHINHNHISQ